MQFYRVTMTWAGYDGQEPYLWGTNIEWGEDPLGQLANMPLNLRGDDGTDMQTLARVLEIAQERFLEETGAAPAHTPPPDEVELLLSAAPIRCVDCYAQPEWPEHKAAEVAEVAA